MIFFAVERRLKFSKSPKPTESDQSKDQEASVTPSDEGSDSEVRRTSKAPYLDMLDANYDGPSTLPFLQSFARGMFNDSYSEYPMKPSSGNQP